MAISILGGSGYQHGVASAESWGNCETFSIAYKRAVNEKVPGIDGQPFFRVMSTLASRDFTVKGEVNGALTNFSLTTVSTLANSSDSLIIGASVTGSIFFDDATVSQNRTGNKDVDAKLSSDPTITAT